MCVSGVLDVSLVGVSLLSDGVAVVVVQPDVITQRLFIAVFLERNFRAEAKLSQGFLQQHGPDLGAKIIITLAKTKIRLEADS